MSIPHLLSKVLHHLLLFYAEFRKRYIMVLYGKEAIKSIVIPFAFSLQL
jgi:aspartokinase-like uncharacterized kinase